LGETGIFEEAVGELAVELFVWLSVREGLVLLLMKIALKLPTASNLLNLTLDLTNRKFPFMSMR
jgi:hypothetical protein